MLTAFPLASFTVVEIAISVPGRFLSNVPAASTAKVTASVPIYFPSFAPVEFPVSDPDPIATCVAGLMDVPPS